MTTFVLVHGGWGGGWEWARAAELLRSRGNDVHTPTLTGLGDRAHLADPTVGLATHVQDVVATIECMNLEEVVLVGHSDGGMVATAGVVDRIPERIARLVYLDGSCRSRGSHATSCADRSGPRGSVDWPLRRVMGGWSRCPSPATSVSRKMFAAWYLPRLVPQPLATLDDPAVLPGAGANVPRSFVRFLDEEGMEQDNPISASAKVARDAGWGYVELIAPHDLHISDPARIVTLLESPTS